MQDGCCTHIHLVRDARTNNVAKHSFTLSERLNVMAQMVPVLARPIESCPMLHDRNTHKTNT